MSEGTPYPHKEKADWKVVGDGKSIETLKKNMASGRKWTIKWKNLDEYEGDNENEKFNFTMFIIIKWL